MFSAASTSDTFFKTKFKSVQPVPKNRKNIFLNSFLLLNQKERSRFVFLILLDVLISILDILSLAFLLWIVQFFIQPDANFSSSFLPGWMLHKDPVAFIGFFFLLFSLKNLAAFFIAKAQFRFIGRVAVRISRNNLISYQQAGFEEFVQVDSSVHLRKIAYQPFDFCQYMLSGIQQIITQSSLIIIAISAILLFNAKLFFLLLLILLPPVTAVFYFIKKRLTTAKWFIKKGNEKSFQYLADALKGYVDGNVYGKNDFFLRRFVDQRQNFSKHLFDSMSLQLLPSRLIEIFALAGLFVLIVIATWTGDNSSASLITIGAFMAAAYKIIPGMVKIVNTVSQIRAYEFSLDELAGDEIVPDRNEIQVNPIQSVQFENISFRYGEAAVLENISFSLERGDFMGIAGRSGKGKTTIFNLLLGFLKPEEGEFFVNGVPANDLKDHWPSISYVRQQAFFIHDTIEKNITLEEETSDPAGLERAIKLSGLEQLIQDTPEGIHKIITENGKNISGGQQQRIVLARALYKNADLILLDEPFNELDEASEFLLLQHFRALADSGKIVVMITHNRKALSFCNKLISLDEA